jgi:hypothetical protein
MMLKVFSLRNKQLVEGGEVAEVELSHGTG